MYPQIRPQKRAFRFVKSEKAHIFWLRFLLADLSGHQQPFGSKLANLCISVTMLAELTGCGWVQTQAVTLSWQDIRT